jgi:hypothetical protein
MEDSVNRTQETVAQWLSTMEGYKQLTPSVKLQWGMNHLPYHQMKER